MPRDAARDPAAATLYARLIRRLGRNARPHGDDAADGMLDAADARALWRTLLDQGFTPAQEAALLATLRVHGESGAMLAAFARESLGQASGAADRTGPRTVVLPCVGAARKQPALAALLALQLARSDVPVLLVTAGDGPASTAAVLQALRVTACADRAAAMQALTRTRLAWLPLDACAPALARVLARRAELGFRNSGHAVTRLLAPVPHALLVAHYTHPGYRRTLGAALTALEATAVLVRGTEGEPVAWDAPSTVMQVWHAGRLLDERGSARPDDGPAATTQPADAATAPAVPTQADGADPTDAAATARLISAILAGSAVMPTHLSAQAHALATLARRLT